MTPANSSTGAPAAIQLRNISRWYGEILGVNKVSVDISPGITGLVGPNGSGKSTLMNIICGLLRPGQGSAVVLGRPVWNNPELRRHLGYCSQVDRFYESFSGYQFIYSMLKLHGRGPEWARSTALDAIERVNMTEAAGRAIGGYSKGMRQRIKIALALAHQPDVLVLDEPFNGLDPVGRREMMHLFQGYAAEGRTVLLSSHILHEVERMTSRILMMSNGYVMAEGEVKDVRDLLRRHPFRVFVRCSDARRLASILLNEDGVMSVQIADAQSMTLTTRDPDNFYLRLNHVLHDHDIDLEVVTLEDENVQSIYRYLSGREFH